MQRLVMEVHALSSALSLRCTSFVGLSQRYAGRRVTRRVYITKKQRTTVAAYCTLLGAALKLDFYLNNCALIRL